MLPILDVSYDAIGNILSKSDVGSYNYDGINAGPHALTSVNSPTPTANPLAKFAVNWEWNGETIPQTQPQIHDSQFQYDANGNIKVSGDRYVWWTAFDKPYRMERYNGANGSVTTGSNLEYDAEFNRIYKLQDDGQATVYIGKDYERITESDGHIIHRYTINTGGAAIQIERANGTGFDQPKYLLADNLGSTNVILDASGNVEQTLAFDPWGMRLNVGDVSAVNSITNKGYTGHEMDDEVGLVNMNARIYDPYLGRFLSADPVLQDPYDMQSFNRYSYVSNNPLRYTDPTGNAYEDVGNEPNGCSDGAGCIRDTGGGTVLDPSADLDYGCYAGCPAHPSGNPNGPSNNGAGHRACVASGQCVTPPHLVNANAAAAAVIAIALVDGPQPGPADIIAAGVGLIVGLTLDDIISIMEGEGENTSVEDDTGDELGPAGPDGNINGNPYDGAVGEPVIVVDSDGNAIPVGEGE